jgi:hypothetical protein
VLFIVVVYMEAVDAFGAAGAIGGRTAELAFSCHKVLLFDRFPVNV